MPQQLIKWKKADRAIDLLHKSLVIAEADVRQMQRTETQIISSRARECLQSRSN
ncbi:hypothetical protein QUB63_10765 [Microcoleus sp. ARI1-B5]|uniref:hypothetical protein n=1 Tax=unclassified Microcoleus TaxID=2642155 RepID=UPI002FD360F5